MSPGYLILCGVSVWIEGEATLTMYPLCTGSTHELLQVKGHKASGARRNIMPPQLLDQSLCDASSKTEQALRLARASELLQHAPGQPGYHPHLRTSPPFPPSPPFACGDAEQRRRRLGGGAARDGCREAKKPHS